jgi:hypothetical protein
LTLQATDIPMPRSSGVDWSLYHEESPKNNPIFSHAAMMELFNHTATFRLASLQFYLIINIYSTVYIIHGCYIYSSTLQYSMF